MIDIKLIRENPKDFKEKIATRNVKINIDEIIKLDEEYRAMLQKSDDARATKNQASEKIAKASGDEKKKLIEEMKTADNGGLEDGLKEIWEKLENLLFQTPNIPLADVPVGPESANQEMKRVGEPRKYDFEVKDHLDLGEELGIIDVKRAAKAVGTRFGYLIGDGARLEFALIQYTMDLLLNHDFKPIVPPVLLKSEYMRAMGYLEHGGDQEIYHLPKDDMYLIGTSEQAIGPMHADEVLKEEELPLRYVGYSPCFRREAGAYGKDTKGILRVHQFDKIEMFSFTHPEKSSDEHEFFLALQEKLMQGLELPYRVLKLATGDIGTPSARTFDIETWMPSQNTYRETHSTSTCTDFQARRLKIRYKNKDGKNELVHTVNGTAFAIGRILIAIMENNQQADGSIEIPKVLRPFMGGRERIEGSK